MSLFWNVLDFRNNIYNIRYSVISQVFFNVLRERGSSFSFFRNKTSGMVACQVTTIAATFFLVKEKAIEALHLCNGYKLNGRPMIISYGKGT